ncbi:MAG: hypothetical protein ACYS9X_09870 [Planctomycetota bacterium]|jgi:hypothetical protein
MPAPPPTDGGYRTPRAKALAVVTGLTVLTVSAALGLAACGGRGARAPSDPSDPEEVLRRLRALKADAASGAVTDSRAQANDPERDATLSGAPAGRLEGAIRDAEGGKPLAARVWIEDGGGTEAGADLSGVGFWCGGRFSVPLLPGRARVEVTAGRRRSVSYQELIVKPGRRARVRVDLRRPAALGFESRGWVGADLFRPVGGGTEALRRRASLDLLALAARAEGVAFCGAAAPWGEGAEASADRRKIERECAALSGAGLTLAPAWRGPDAPFYGSMFFLGGREPRILAPGGWDPKAPNFLAIERARLQGPAAILRGIAEGREMDPRTEIVTLAPELADLYRDASVALGETASELPFDVAAGVLPDALALSGSAEDEAVWFRLLSMRHRIPSVHVAAGSFSGGTIPAERTFVKLRTGEEPTPQAVAEAVRAGRTMCSTGPFAFLKIDGRGPGSVLKGNGRTRAVIFEAYASTERGGEITVLELIRNGKVIRSEPGQGRSFIAAQTLIPENETAWYIARARSGKKGERVAWTSPVYFEGPGYARPRPVATLVRGRVTDARTATPLKATVSARLFGREVAAAESDPVTGEYNIKCSPAALLTASAPGHAPAGERVFFHTGAMREILAIHTNASGRGARVLAEDRTYEQMRLACAEAKVDLRLERQE